MKHAPRLTQGFSIVEMIVSLALFSVVVTMSVGALLMLVAANGQQLTEQSVMTNLSFAMDSMTREMRTGTYYYCATAANYNAFGPNAIFDEDAHEALGTTTQDCVNGGVESHLLKGVSFIEAGDSVTGANSRILYFFDNTDPDRGMLMRRVGNEDAQSIVSSGINIIDAHFYVTGSESLSAGDEYQPTITIVVEAQDVANTLSKVHTIQTTVTQRILDI